MNALERVQRVFTKRVFRRFGLPSRPYPQRLERLGLTELAKRRESLDLAFTHSVYKGDHFCPALDFVGNQTGYNLRKPAKLVPNLKPSKHRRKLLGNRIASNWNRLEPKVQKLSRKAFKDSFTSGPK